MLQNDYLLVKIGVDTAENERNLLKSCEEICNYPTGPAAPRPDCVAVERDPPGAASRPRAAHAARTPARVWRRSPQTPYGSPRRKKACYFQGGACRGCRTPRFVRLTRASVPDPSPSFRCPFRTMSRGCRGLCKTSLFRAREDSAKCLPLPSVKKFLRC